MSNHVGSMRVDAVSFNLIYTVKRIPLIVLEVSMNTDLSSKQYTIYVTRSQDRVRCLPGSWCEQKEALVYFYWNQRPLAPNSASLALWSLPLYFKGNSRDEHDIFICFSRKVVELKDSEWEKPSISSILFLEALVSEDMISILAVFDLSSLKTYLYLAFFTRSLAFGSSLWRRNDDELQPTRAMKNVKVEMIHTFRFNIHPFKQIVIIESNKDTVKARICVGHTPPERLQCWSGTRFIITYFSIVREF